MAGQRKSHVFRVTLTSLSRSESDESVDARFRQTLNENLADEEKLQIRTDITILPSCYGADSERVALVRFHGGVPQFLSELTTNPLREWQGEMGDGEINIDCHFFGFTQLYAPNEEEPVADIIAITGLDGHAYGSWQGRGNLSRMWLRDFLSKDLPQCRTMIYGYNSKLSSHGVDTILDYGRELMEEIKKIRKTKKLQQRPLFFIAHSFGGIIMAHCLVRAIQMMDEDHPAITSLHRATYGMILFGIPHKGLIVDDIQQMLASDRHPREQLLQQISYKSDLLVHQLADFRNLIRDRKVTSFYETEQTRRLVLDPVSRQWRRTGDFITIVDSDSALLQLPDHVEVKVPLHTDHSMIVKFDAPNAAGYRTVLDNLRQFVEDAPSLVAARFDTSGYGKTAIASVLIDQIAEETKRDSRQALHFFYCSGGNEYQTSPSSIMATFLHQILASLPVGHNFIEDQWGKGSLKGLAQDSIPLGEATILHESTTAQFDRVYIVVDALDEIAQDKRQQFLEVINRLITKTGTCYYKIFVTSRDNEDIRHFLSSEPNLRIRPSDNAGDIKKVIRTKFQDCVQKKTLLRGKFDSETKYYLREVLLQRAQGMFLWVRLQFDELRHAATQKDLVHLIESSCANLEQTYQKLWSRIEGLYLDDLDEYTFLDICHNMVTYDWELETFRLIHTTAREYLMNHLDRPQAHTWIAKICLQELLNSASLIEIPRFGVDGTATVSKPIEFILYAALHWHYHSRNCIRTSEYEQAERAFLQHDRAPRVWIKILKSATRDHCRNIKTLLSLQQAFPSTTDSLFLAACFFSLEEIFSVLRMDRKPTTSGSVRIPQLKRVQSCISWSSHFSNMSALESVARDLVNKSREDIKDYEETGAICAAEQGHENIFKELWQGLNSASKITLRDFTGSCCRLLATACKQIKILDYIDLEPLPFESPPYFTLPFAFLGGSLVGVSAFLGHIDMLQYWKRKMSTKSYYFPNEDLIRAILRDDESATRLLLDHTEVDINCETYCAPGHGAVLGTPLRIAARRGYHKLIKVLIRHPEIDVNLQDSYGQTVLMDMADSGLGVEALCHHRDINVNLRNSLGLTALEIFIRDCHAGALAELIKHQDIDVNQRCRWNEVPLITAVRLRHIDVVKILLQAPDIDVNACDESGYNALDIARRLDHAPLIRLLSQRKGDITDKSEEETEDLSMALLRHPINWI